MERRDDEKEKEGVRKKRPAGAVNGFAKGFLCSDDGDDGVTGVDGDTSLRMKEGWRVRTVRRWSRSS